MPETREFTYYPLDEQFCAFRVAVKPDAYRQCERYPRETIDNYRFCANHAQVIRRLTNPTTQPAKER